MTLQRKKHFGIFIAFACAMLSVALSFITHLASPMALDETGSWGMAREGPLAALKTSVFAQGQGPLYFVLLSLHMRIFGDDLLALRSLSMVMGMLSIFLLAMSAPRLASRREVAFGSVVVFLFAPITLYYATLARPYALAMLLVSLGIF
jgi:hypothetical protein